ncbi:MAG: aldo/keto reductase, partial [Gammaproteobacteria bacterium]
MKLILGSMTFGDQVDQQTAAEMIERYLQTGNNEIDTAYTYCDGKTEALLGNLLSAIPRERIYLATKVNPWNDAGLRPEQVHKQLNESLERLGCEQVDLLYLHSPDLETPVEQTLQACFELYQQGKFRDFGLSNYAAWQVAEVVETCRRHGW